MFPELLGDRLALPPTQMILHQTPFLPRSLPAPGPTPLTFAGSGGTLSWKQEGWGTCSVCPASARYTSKLQYRFTWHPLQRCFAELLTMVSVL